jgi:hypothetical protein
MSVFYKNAIAEFPKSIDIIKVIDDIRRKKCGEIKIDGIIDSLNPPYCFFDVVEILSFESDEYSVKRSVKVIHPIYGNIGEFESIVDMPDKIIVRGENVQILLEYLETFYVIE